MTNQGISKGGFERAPIHIFAFLSNILFITKSILSKETITFSQEMEIGELVP